MFHSSSIKEVKQLFSSKLYFTNEAQGEQLSSGFEAMKVLKSLVKRYTIKAVGPANQPGYICVIRKEDLVRIGFSRRPKNKLIQGSKQDEAQELVWYGYTENMLTAKQKALAYFAQHRADGDWLKISPLVAMTYLKRQN
jgi:hypothetical protein